MDTDTMVEGLIDSGARLIRALDQAGSQVVVAAWLKQVDEGRLSLVIATKDVEQKGPIAAYRTLAEALRQVGDSRLTVSDVKLVSEEHRIARDLLEGQPKGALQVPRRVPFTSVGGLPVDEVYVYPQFQTVADGPRQSVLRFALRTTDDLMTVMSRFHPHGKPLLNSFAWRKKEPRSCKVTSVAGRPHPADTSGAVVINVEVTCRPKGCITYVGGTKYDGWTALQVDRSTDGTLLDGHGSPLRDGHPPVYRRVEVYGDIDFNQIDFGEFVSETEVDGIRHLSVEQVIGRLAQSRRINASLTSSFVAARRHRPAVKIVLSNAPSGTATDGFGTLIRTINNSTAQLQQVILNHVNELVNGFVEGRYSIKNMSNEELIFVELNDILVDCSPNEEGKDSRFDCLCEYLPEAFLDEVAMRLMATYDLDASVVDGPRPGLVLKRISREW
jgi:hypothetical protein